MECNKCEFSELCGLYSKDSQCINPNLRERTKKQPLVWHKCKAGYKFPSDAIVIPDDERTTDRDPRLVRCAVWDSKYILINDLKKLPVENG